MMESSGTIEIRIHSLAELFNPLDPSPLHARALASSAERYLISCAIVLALSVGLQGWLGDANGRGPGAGFAEGLLILGWVAMWRPFEILLYEHWESHLDHAVLDRLAGVAVEYSIRTDATPHA